MSREFPRTTVPQVRLPSYAHPPLVQVRMALHFDAPIALDAAAFTEQLGPAWIPLRSAGVKSLPDHPAGSGEIHCFRSVLGDYRLDAHAQGMDFLWDGRSGETYPHYESLRDVFLMASDAWTRSVTGAAPLPDRWQIAYRNRFPRGTVWHQLDDLRFCRLLANAVDSPLAGRLQDFRQTWTYQVEAPVSELCCELWLENSADDQSDDAIWLELTCAGDGVHQGDAEWLSEFDTGRKLIVATFRQLMSAEANDYWGLQGPPAGLREKKTPP